MSQEAVCYFHAHKNHWLNFSEKIWMSGIIFADFLLSGFVIAALKPPGA